MKTNLSRIALFAVATLTTGIFVLAACDDSSSGVHETPGNDGGSSSGTSGASSGTSGSSSGTSGASSGTSGSSSGTSGNTNDCVMNPKTHDDLINACTDAQAFDKKPSLPLLQSDGGLPPLP